MIPVPLDIETGLPKWSEEQWRRLSESDQRIALYHNAAYRQRLSVLYRELKRDGSDDG